MPCICPIAQPEIVNPDAQTQGNPDAVVSYATQEPPKTPGHPVAILLQQVVHLRTRQTPRPLTFSHA